MIPVYIGTYTDGASRGIYRLELDGPNTRLSSPVLVAEAVNPTFLAWHPSRPVLYAASETDTVGADKTGAVLAYRVEADGSLALIDLASSGGAGTCFLSVHPAATHVFVANYTAGSVAALAILPDGALGAMSSLVRHTGSSAHRTRQAAPHAHAIMSAPGGAFVLAADLGADRLLVYRFDPADGALTPHEPPAAVARAGAGPRHLAWHPSGRAAFLINELDSTISTYAWNGASGTLELRDTISTLPDSFTGENITAEVRVHPSGRFVYGSNRGHDSIAAFRAGGDSTLTLAGFYPTGGRTPRNFALDPAGEFLLAANQESDSLVLFRIDQRSGALLETGAHAAVPSPVFVGMPRVP